MATPAPRSLTPLGAERPTPSPPRWPGFAAAGILALWYLATMGRGLQWYDSGEFALVAQQLGLGHPPGQPLYTLLLALCARLPGVPPLVGMNLLSAGAAAACALPADALARRLAAAAPWPRFLALLALGALSPFWDQASRIELYSLATLGSLGLLALGLRAAEPQRPARAWALPGLLAGGLACVNPVAGLAATAAVALLAAPGLLRRGALRSAQALGAAAGGATLGLAPYAYLAWVRGRAGVFVWGRLDDTAGWFEFLRGSDYAHTAHAEWALVPAHLLDWGSWLLWEGALPVVLAGALGWALSPRLRRASALLVPAVAGVAFSMTYARYLPEVPDYNGYLAPGLWLLGLGLCGLLQRLPQRAGLALAAALLLAASFGGERPLWQRSRAQLDLPLDLAQRWLEDQPPGGVLLVASDHLVFPLLYRQQVLGERPDVLLINVGFASSSWYWRWLREVHPDLPAVPLAAPSRELRLRRLLAALPQPAIRTEDLDLARSLGLPSCPARWGQAVGALPCPAPRAPDEQAFRAPLEAAWRGAVGRDPTSRRVVAALATRRAAGLWAAGWPAAALRALQSGVPPGLAARLPLPEERPRAAAAPLPRLPESQIGSPAQALALGAAMLTVLAEPEMATAWAAEIDGFAW